MPQFASNEKEKNKDKQTKKEVFMTVHGHFY